MSAELVAIFTSPKGGAPMTSVEEAMLVEGNGIEGDRYAEGSGTFMKPGTWNEVTLFEAEAIDVVNAAGIEFTPAEIRRNLMTRGIDLNSLIGKQFRVGEVELRGDRSCDPCNYLEKLTKHPGLKEALYMKGGLRATILKGGRVKPGDAISVVPEAVGSV